MKKLNKQFILTSALILCVGLMPRFACAGVIFAAGQPFSSGISINFPDQVVSSVAHANAINSTGGVVGDLIGYPGLSLHFNGYGTLNSNVNDPLPAYPGTDPLLLHASHGNAQVEPVNENSLNPNGPYTHPYMFQLYISAPHGYGLTGIDFQLAYYNNNQQTGPIAFAAYDVYGNLIGNSSSLSSASSGQDPFYALASGGSLIGTIEILTDSVAPLQDIQHVDIQAIQQVPEPSSVALLGIGGIGFAIRAFRRRTVTV